MAEMETREFEVRADLEERTITGLAVPYGQDANIGGAYMERFVPGAISDVTDVKLFYGHEEPIGKVLTGRDTDAGYEITAKVSDTARGNEVMTLMRDGVLNKFSVGFVPLESERDGSTVTRTKVSLKEVSVVPFPAFAGANITEVREDGGTPAETSEPQPEQDNSMPENIELDVRAVQDEVAELRRVVEAGQTVATPAPLGAEFRSQGEFAKALVAGDIKAQEFARTASTSADAAVVAPWFGYINTLIANNRPTVSAFSRAALPATGLTVEYSKIDANTLAVGQQDPENEALSFGNLTFETVSTPVKTYGGYTSFSRQYVERSQVNTLDQVFQGLALAYAGASNGALVTALLQLWTTPARLSTQTAQTASSLGRGYRQRCSLHLHQHRSTPRVHPHRHRRLREDWQRLQQATDAQSYCQTATDSTTLEPQTSLDSQALYSVYQSSLTQQSAQALSTWLTAQLLSPWSQQAHQFA
jgi:uncharacterized protein